MRMFRLPVLSLSAALLLAAFCAAPAAGISGRERRSSCTCLEIAAVYLQPVEMEPAGMMLPPPRRTCIWRPTSTATRDNANGFADGEWNPQPAHRLPADQAG